jgi:hypothetical protein
MKIIGMFFVGAVLSLLVAQNAQAGVTVGQLHKKCLELPDAQNAGSGDPKSVAAAIDTMYLQGYIVGVTDEMNDLANVGMDFDWPKTNGEVVDAVCQYFTLHPEQWSWDAASRWQSRSYILSIRYPLTFVKTYLETGTPSRRSVTSEPAEWTLGKIGQSGHPKDGA